MIDPSRHAQDRGTLESLVRKIPGIKGYAEKEDRRESDHLTRMWLADRLQQSKRGLDEALRRIADSGQLDQLMPLERLRSRVDGFILKLRAAVRGYSGFFDFVQVGEETLDQIYRYDLSLTSDVQSLAESIEQLATASDLSGTSATDRVAKLDALERAFERRTEILKGVEPA